MSNSFCLSSPSFSASTKASDTAIIETPRIMLLQIFAACPLPAPPACTMVLPIFSRIESARSNARSGPPTMKLSVPAAAPPTPPAARAVGGGVRESPPPRRARGGAGGARCRGADQNAGASRCSLFGLLHVAAAAALPLSRRGARRQYRDHDIGAARGDLRGLGDRA